MKGETAPRNSKRGVEQREIAWLTAAAKGDRPGKGREEGRRDSLP